MTSLAKIILGLKRATAERNAKTMPATPGPKMARLQISAHNLMRFLSQRKTTETCYGQPKNTGRAKRRPCRTDADSWPSFFVIKRTQKPLPVRSGSKAVLRNTWPHRLLTMECLVAHVELTPVPFTTVSRQHCAATKV